MPRIYIRQVRSRSLYPNWDLVVKEVEKVLDNEVKPLFLNHFQRIVESWEHKPQFGAKKSITDKFISIYVFPRGPYKWLWELVSITGAEAHTIEAKDAPLLVFMWGGPGSYDAKTDTAGHYKGSGTVDGGEITKMLVVDHPGFPPRNLEKHITRWGTPKARKSVENAFRRGVRKAKASPKQPLSRTEAKPNV